MKKTTLLASIVAIAFTANAQTKNSPATVSSVHPLTGTQLQISTLHASRAAGDTLMYMKLPGLYVNPTDNATFDINTEDIDGLTTNNTGAPVDFSVTYSTNADLNGSGNPTGENFFHPWETPGVDTSFFWMATSWFNPAGQANNWLEFGPLTIPATGAELKWYDRTNPSYRDGYKVIVSTTISSPMSFADFTDAPIFTKADAYPSPTYATDTTWVLRTASIPASYNGQVVAIAFNHTANDMDVLYLDEILLIEGGVSGINENTFVNGVKLLQNNPNPFNHLSNINYELEKNAAVALTVYDVTGKKIIDQTEGNQTAGKHNLKINADNLSAGVYYYSLTVGTTTTATKKMVVIK